MAALRAVRSPAREPASSLFEQAFAPATLRMLDRVRLRAAHASGERPGHTRVRNRGDVSGTELERHVAYVRGDDLRRIDWNVYARLDELVTRRFVAEREVPVWFVVDSSASMGPDEPASKLDMARAIAAMLATVSLSGGDRVSLAAIPGRKDGGPGATMMHGPLRSRRALAEARGFLAGVHQAAGPADLAAGLDQLLRRTRRGLVVLISDFLCDLDHVARALDVIASRLCEAKLVQVLSREDRDPVWLYGHDVLIDRETGAEHRIEPSPDTFRRYEAVLLEHIASLGRVAARHGMASALTVSDVGLTGFLRDELPRLGLGLVR
ncbi:MAG: DUF58 domain-containing protein [Deltaproteobacteria bacterium]|nr:DUF58 domain-containing protein [Deltaproteobacteria bacterium]